LKRIAASQDAAAITLFFEKNHTIFIFSG